MVTERYAAEKEVYDKKLAERTAEQQESDKKPRGKEPKPPMAGRTAGHVSQHPNDK